MRSKLFGKTVQEAAEPSSKRPRWRGYVHIFCALILAGVIARILLDARPAIVMAAQIDLSAPSAFVVYRLMAAR